MSSDTDKMSALRQIFLAVDATFRRFSRKGVCIHVFFGRIQMKTVDEARDAEVGTTVFLCKSIVAFCDVQRGAQGLNVAENWNATDDFICYLRINIPLVARTIEREGMESV